jgi:hypothetical protein
MQYQDIDMNSNFTNSGWQTGVNAVAVVVCEGTVAAEAAAGDTMSSEVRVG